MTISVLHPAARLRRLLAAATLVLSLFASVVALAQRAIPAWTGPVVDEASLLDAASRDRLEALARAARDEQGGQGVQLQILIVPTLEGESIEDFSIRVAERWKLGTRGRDNGVLITVARDEHRVRIEVGGGLEGELTDAQSARIIRQTIAPAFREGRYGEGLYQASVQVLGVLGALPKGVVESGQTGKPAARAERGPGVVAYAIGLLVVIFVLTWLSRGRGGGLGTALLLGGLGGWGWRGDGRGRGRGGGWDGGGGGFSGGGASGNW